MWQYVSMAKFLNMSYTDVQNISFDEFELLQRMQQIYNYTQTEQGQKILKDNIRYLAVTPDIDKLRSKYGEEENNE